MAMAAVPAMWYLASATLNFVALNPLGTLAVGDYTFITATGGLGAGVLALGSSTIVVNGVTYNLSLSHSTATAMIPMTARAAAVAARVRGGSRGNRRSRGRAPTLRRASMRA